MNQNWLSQKTTRRALLGSLTVAATVAPAATRAQEGQGSGLYFKWQSKLESLVKSVLPKPREAPWMDVEWRTDINEARLEAQKTGKPILVWLTGGDPLGTC